ncbi:MAG: serine/threonine protein kinase [bacterium]|nr:serine/threonine protein kinase [bacterium]
MLTELHKESFQIFRASYERGGADRKAYIETACGGNDELRQEVESLLALTDQPDGIFEKPLVPMDHSEASELGAGDLIDRYPVQELIDQGGMGTVYKALHPVTENTVAIKVIRPGFVTEHQLKHFLTERKLLARLNHPNIARCLDADTTETGQPYLVMEYVDGIPIDRFCRENDLSLGHRVRLCERICDAVHFAHQNLIIHRDLKPANILVTRDGEPKLVDFGIGWLIDASPQSSPTDTTWQMPSLGFLGTLQYASPEQIMGTGFLSTSTDVYSLGVVLYEILTGHYPFQKWNSSFFALKQAICTEQPEKPSTAVISAAAEPDVDPSELELPRSSKSEQASREAAHGNGHNGHNGHQELQRRLAGDLDCIVLKALHKDPGKRYSSAKEVSEDLRRHRQSFPVSAHEQSLSYSARKLTQRHRATAITALFLVLVTIGSAVLFYGFWQREQSLKAAIEDSKAALERSWYVRDYMAGLFEIRDPQKRGPEIKARELLDDQILDLEKARELDDLDEEERARLLDQLPEDLPGLMDAIGWSYYGLGFLQEADDWTREGFLRRSADGRERDGDWVIAMLRRSAVESARGQGAEAATRRAEALELVRSGDVDDKPLAQALNDLALFLDRRGELQAAADILRESLAMKKRLPGVIDAGIAIGTNNLATALEALGQYREAAEAFRESLALKEELYGTNAESASLTRSNLAVSLRELGASDVDQRAASWDEAETLFRQSLDEYRAIHGESHQTVATVHTNLGLLLHLRGSSDQARTGDLEEAGRSLEQGLQIFEDLYGDSSPVGIVLRLHASWLRTMGRPEGALQDAERALEILGGAYGSDHWRTADARSVLGGCLADLDRFDEAEPLLRESLPIIEQAKGDSSRATVEARQRLDRLRQARAQR